MALNIQRGRRHTPVRAVIYGPEKLGKSTLAAHLLATIADRDQALTAAALRSNNERAAAKSGIADALVTVPPDIAAELDALRLADTTYASRLASAQDSLGAAERIVAAPQKRHSLLRSPVS
jgi:RecA/RadA recombinase